MSTISERVQRGAALLDAHVPDWWQDGRFDLSRFDLKSGCDCVVGQVWPGESAWDEDRFDLAVAAGWLDLDFEVATSHGFYAGSPFDSFNFGEYGELQAEWVRVITERRAAA